MDIFLAFFIHSVWRLSTSSRQLSQQVFRQDSAAGESRSLPHQIKERVLSIAANESYIA